MVEKELFLKKMKKNMRKIWWNQIMLVPLQPLTKSKGV